MKDSTFQKTRRGEEGVALVITLALVVLITGLALAFFVRVGDSEKKTKVSTDFAAVSVLTKTSLEAVLGDLRTEMLAGSRSPIGSSGSFIWMEPSATAAWAPYRQVKPTVASAGASFENLVKQSVSGRQFFPAGTSPYADLKPKIQLASGINTASPSADKHWFPATRWNLPALTIGSFVTEQTPDWVYLTKAGVSATQTYSPASKDKNSTDYIIGRFAFNIYDTSGLLDINVAGFPSGQATRSQDKGGLSWAKLDAQVDVGGTLTPIATSTDSFIDWRNATSKGNFPDYVTDFGLKEGFLKHKFGDRTFDTRGDLIRYVKRAGSPLTSSVLPYLTTFSRTVNAPHWSPTKPTGSTVDYFANKNDVSSFNRFISGVRVTTPFANPRRDGTTAIVGEPLIKERFPLSAIALFAQLNSATSGGEEIKTQIQNYFGLSLNADGMWVPDLQGGQIRTLAQVATLGREPNFFELLKAGILSGALGAKDATASYIKNKESDESADKQILQIGANIIDQYDADSNPTSISTFGLANNGGNTGDVYGIENL